MEAPGPWPPHEQRQHWEAGGAGRSAEHNTHGAGCRGQGGEAGRALEPAPGQASGTYTRVSHHVLKS